LSLKSTPSCKRKPKTGITSYLLFQVSIHCIIVLLTTETKKEKGYFLF